eukprot:COSAG06_NODE_7223_length_2581_cov_2.433118_2_plen_612_part_01
MCLYGAQRKSGAEADSDREPKKHEAEEDTGASAATVDNGTVVCCDSGYPLALGQQLQVWDGTGNILPQNEMPRGRSSMEFHDVYGSTLSPERQNETLGQRSDAGNLNLNLPGVVSETPYYYRKQQQQQKQQQRYSKQQSALPEGQAATGYVKGGKSAAQIESEVDYELDQDDEQWLETLNQNGKEQCHKDWGMFLEEDMEVLIDRYEKADATLHKLAGHSAVRTEVLLHQRPAVPDVRGVSTMVQQQVHEWWMQKRNKRGEQLLRRFRAPPHEDDDDDGKAFRRCSIGPKTISALQSAAAAAVAAGSASSDEIHQVGDIVEANYHGRGQYFGGIIAAVNPNGSFAVKYHDGDCENEVPVVFIRKMTSRRRAPPQATLTPAAAATNNAARMDAVAGSGPGAASGAAAQAAAHTKGGSAAKKQRRQQQHNGATPSASAGAVGSVTPAVATISDVSPSVTTQDAAAAAAAAAGLAAPPSPKAVGDIVEANYHGLGNFYTGSIAAVNENGSYRVQYHDGDCEDEVPGFDVRRLENRRRRKPSASAPAPAPATATTAVAAAAPAPAALPRKQEAATAATAAVAPTAAATAAAAAAAEPKASKAAGSAGRVARASREP